MTTHFFIIIIKHTFIVSTGDIILFNEKHHNYV